MISSHVIYITSTYPFCEYIHVHTGNQNLKCNISSCDYNYNKMDIIIIIWRILILCEMSSLDKC